MIIQRLAKGIKDQDWFIVLLEIMIVVIGILVGLQVDDWNEGRKERDLEKGYLERVAKDIQDSKNTTKSLFSFHEMQIRDIGITVQSLNTCELSPDNKRALVFAFFNMGKLNEPSFIKRTINELEASGGFRLIQSNAIKQIINEVIVEDNQSKGAHRSLLDRVTPAVNRINQLLRFNFPKSANPTSALPTFEDLAFNFEANCNNETLLNDLSYIRVSTHNLQRFFNRRIDIYTRALASINGELKSRYGDE